MTIYAKLTKVMTQVHRIPKNGYNSFHKYNYATESDLTEAIRGILAENGLAFVASCLSQQVDGELRRVEMKFTLADVETGETVESVFWGEGQDKGDKGFYKAYTGAVKYFLMKTFLIPTGDDPEQDDAPSRGKVTQAKRKAPTLDDIAGAAKQNGVSNEALRWVVSNKYKKQKAAQLSDTERIELYDTVNSKDAADKLMAVYLQKASA